MSQQILVLAGDYSGQETMATTLNVLDVVVEKFGLDISLEHGLLGGGAIDKYGEPYPEVTRQQAKAADALLLSAVGGPKWDSVEPEIRPERGLLAIRADLELFANLRPALLFPQLADASSLKPELVADLDILIVRELTGGIYFGEPRGFRETAAGDREGFNTYKYSEPEIRRIAEVAFEAARKRGGRVCSVDKANVLEATMLWREILIDVHQNFSDVTLEHMYVDNAVMQLIREPRQFDVLVTGNLFGDILSDAAAMLTGSIGMLPSASLDANNKGMYEPVHGSAPDIAGEDKVNPLATILSLAMLLRYSFDQGAAADAIENAVSAVLDDGLRTADIASAGQKIVGTMAMGQAVADKLAAV